MAAYYLGLDIGGTKCAVLLATIGNGIRIHDKIRFDTQPEKGFDDVYGRLCDAVVRIVAKNDLTMAQVLAIGVSCGGPLDSRNGVVLCPPNLPGWVNVPLRQMLEERFGIPAYLQNDANACALVEWKLGAGRGTSDMIFLTMGTGMGGGVIANGQLLCGHTDMGGEIGHLRLRADGPVGFGKAGSFEGYASGGGIHQQAITRTRAWMENGHTPAWVRDGHSEEEMTAHLIADYARKGDEDAVAVFHTVGTMLGEGLALLVDSFNPEVIVIGSIFSRCETLLRPGMEAALRREAIPYSLEKLRIVPAETGESIGDLASVMVALYARGVDPLCTTHEDRAQAHLARLLGRYPALAPCRESIVQAYRLLMECFQRGNKLLLIGNGGSCADCEHIAGELMKGFLLKRPAYAEKRESIRALTDALLPGAADKLQQGLPAIVLTGHAALTTAAQNDLDPLLGPAQQVMALGKPGDLVWGISTSGNARNAALCISVGKALGLGSIGLTGENGGRLRELCDCCICVPASNTADIQEYHLPIYHALCAMIEAALFDR